MSITTEGHTMARTEYDRASMPVSLDVRRGSLTGAGRSGRPLRDLFHVEAGSGCWVWDTSNCQGYGKVTIGGRYLFAHRVIYVMLRGSVDVRLDLDHLCRNRACVNPDHLEPVEPRENIIRGVQARDKRTHCPQGHLLTDENVIAYAARQRGWRSCRTCRNEWQQNYRANAGVSA